MLIFICFFDVEDFWGSKVGKSDGVLLKTKFLKFATRDPGTHPSGGNNCGSHPSHPRAPGARMMGVKNKLPQVTLTAQCYGKCI